MVAFKNSSGGGIVGSCYQSVSAERKWHFPVISLFDSYHWLFSFKRFTISWGAIPRVFQRGLSATLLAVRRSGGLKMRGNCPGVWPLSPVWSAFHSDQWEGTMPGTVGGDSVTHRISTIENRFLSDHVHLTETEFWLHDSSVWTLSLLSFSSNVLSPFLTYAELPQTESSAFQISERRSSWFLNELAVLFKVCHEITKKMQQAQPVNTDHSRWKVSVWDRTHCFCLEFGNVFLLLRGEG